MFFIKNHWCRTSDAPSFPFSLLTVSLLWVSWVALHAFSSFSLKRPRTHITPLSPLMGWCLDEKVTVSDMVWRILLFPAFFFLGSPAFFPFGIVIWTLYFFLNLFTLCIQITLSNLFEEKVSSFVRVGPSLSWLFVCLFFSPFPHPGVFSTKSFCVNEAGWYWGLLYGHRPL